MTQTAKKYEIVIRATVTKTYTVEAETENQAYELAHDLFTVAHDPSVLEHYEQETLSIELLEDDSE